MKSIKQITIRFILNFTGMLVFWAGFFRPGFGADTIGQATLPFMNINAAFQYGRYLTYAVDMLAVKLGYSMYGQYKTTYLAMLVFIAAAVTMIQQMFLPYITASMKDTSSEGVCSGTERIIFAAAMWVLSMLPLANVLFSEFYMFPECMIGYSLCYFTGAVAAYLISRARNVKGWVLGILMLCVSCLFYQNGVIFAAILVLFYFYLEQWCSRPVARSDSGYVKADDDSNEVSTAPARHDSSASFRTYFIKSAAVIIAALGIGLVNMKVQSIVEMTSFGKGASKAQHAGSLLDNLPMFAYYLRTFFATSLKLLPRLYLPLLMLLLADAVIAAVLVRKKKYLQIFMTVFTQIVMIGMVSGIPLLMEEIHFYPRIVFPLYLILAGSAMLALVTAREDAEQLFRGWKIMAVFSVLFFLIQGFFVAQIAENHYISNQLDLTYTAMVQQKIRKYEAETGIRVEKVATARDAVSTRYYDGIYYTFDQINERVLGMSTFSLLRYTSDEDHDFQLIDMDEDVFKKYFEGRDWVEFDVDEQVVIEGDTLYWCAF